MDGQTDKVTCKKSAVYRTGKDFWKGLNEIPREGFGYRDALHLDIVHCSYFCRSGRACSKGAREGGADQADQGAAGGGAQEEARGAQTARK